MESERAEQINTFSYAQAAIPLRRRIFYVSLIILGGSFLIEGGLSFVLALKAALRTGYNRPETKHCRYDEELGWSHRTNVVLPDCYGSGKALTTNAQGFRTCQGDYFTETPNDRFRIICLGDSYTLGHGVGDSFSWPAQLESKCNSIQAVNMGQGGYGIDQAYLWYRRDGTRLQADVLVFAVIADDFQRMTRTRDKYSGYAKPILRIEGDSLVVDNIPLPKEWPRSAIQARFRRFAKEIAIGRSLKMLPTSRDGGQDNYGPAARIVFRELNKLCRNRDQDFVLVYLPAAWELRGPASSESVWITKFAAEEGIACINLREPFSNLPKAQITHYFRGGHPNEVGYSFIADQLLSELRGILPHMPDCP